MRLAAGGGAAAPRAKAQQRLRQLPPGAGQHWHTACRAPAVLAAARHTQHATHTLTHPGGNSGTGLEVVPDALLPPSHSPSSTRSQPVILYTQHHTQAATAALGWKWSKRSRRAAQRCVLDKWPARIKAAPRPLPRHVQHLRCTLPAAGIRTPHLVDACALQSRHTSNVCNLAHKYDKHKRVTQTNMKVIIASRDAGRMRTAVDAFARENAAAAKNITPM